jgi:peptidoglycan/LPS O-acetylase OafA/YrhL
MSYSLYLYHWPVIQFVSRLDIESNLTKVIVMLVVSMLFTIFRLVII